MAVLSPAPAASVNASPRSIFHHFQYAPAAAAVHSPRHSPSWISAALSRRQSPSSPATSIASPSYARPKRYVDAATQYSPMEPTDYATGAALPHVSPSEVERLEPPPPPAPKPMALSDEQPSAPSASAKPAKPLPVSSKQRKEAQAAHAAQPLSPPKRKNPDETSSTSTAPVNAVESPSTLAKRPKPDAGPVRALPQRYEHCAVEDMVVLISHMLGELIETNDALALRSGHLTRFHSRTAPGISVLDYLHRLAKHATLSPPLLLSMVYYIDRLCALYPEFTINTLTVHRFLITAATVAAKGLSDAFWNNSTYAKVGGVRVAELKLLELEFLYRVDWKIVPNPEVLVAYYRGLVERCPGYTLEAEEQSGEEEEEEEEEDDDDDDDSDVVDEEDNDGDDEIADATTDELRAQHLQRYHGTAKMSE
ncbi:cyclin-domain-containing protein [Lasiosphaeris hirsuta]|uniref:Cyclin-domain-containing protein n=1 Tax=Lasiosphaeris hirsuta TaxID=260670 RepID=A0AA40DLA3_9PEZI|nr:cyclin-domain-containing protein [Lasiosphaeris hirsuta]